MSKVFNIVVKSGSDTPTTTINLSGQYQTTDYSGNVLTLSQDTVDSIRNAATPFILNVNGDDCTVLFKNEITAMRIVTMSGKAIKSGFEVAFSANLNFDQNNIIFL